MTDLVILNGPEIEKTLRVREGVVFLGRSLDNDIRIEDKTVSRRHLKIESIRDKHFVTDLSSRNGTFYNGKYAVPGHEVEVEEGVPLAIGMTVICFGEGCREQIVPFLDTVSLIREKKRKGEASEEEIICKVNRSSKDVSESFSEEVVQSVLKGGKPLIFSKGYTEDRSALVETLEVQKIEAVMCIPLINGPRIIGAMDYGSHVC
ncbi:MAG: FHA domain-containing protein [Deltaproteobacteria bacterium]|nr:FHA domain-containing protein [Deltaproteobacteria bacterium]